MLISFQQILVKHSVDKAETVKCQTHFQLHSLRVCIRHEADIYIKKWWKINAFTH